MIKPNFAFNKITKETNILKHYFYLEAVYKDILKKNYFSKDFYQSIYNLNKTEHVPFLFRRLNMYSKNFYLAGSKFDLNNFHHKGNYTEKESSEFYKNKRKELILAEILYNYLVDNFYKMTSKYNIFSVFKSKDSKDNFYYLLVGATKLEKLFMQNKMYLDNNYPEAILKHIKDVNTLPIGNYFIMVKFSKALFTKSSDSHWLGQKNVKPFPTNIIKVKYIMSEKEIDDNFNQVNLDFNYC